MSLPRTVQVNSPDDAGVCLGCLTTIMLMILLLRDATTLIPKKST